DEDVAGNPATFLALVARGGGNVVGGQHRTYFHTFHFQQFGRHVEIHDVAGIVAIKEKNAGAAIGCKGSIHGWLRRRRSKDVADRAGVGQPLADIAQKGRLMTRAATDHYGDLAGTWSIL